MRGMFVVIEGSDGAGKSTFRERLERELTDKGIDYICTREPGGTSIGEGIREILLDTKNTVMSPRCEALLYAASRAQHVEEQILPALDAGKLVICERFVISSLAYQGYGRELGEETVRSINLFATAGVRPDLTLFFYIPQGESLQRKIGEKDRLESEEDSFHQRVAEGYEQLLSKEDLVRIDATKDIESIYTESAGIILDAWRRWKK